MKKLLIPTDFSDGAFKAIVYGIELAKEFNSEIIICHAFELPAQGINVLIDISAELQKNAQQDLNSLEKKIVKSGLANDVNIEYLAMLGEINDVIETIGSEKDIDLVLMGTKGESDLASKLFGTNTVSAIKNCSLPLLVIPSGAYYKPLKNVAFAIDYLKPSNDNVLNLLRDLSLHYNSKVTMLNVHTDGEIGEFIVSVKDMQNWYGDHLGDVNLDYVFVENYLIESGVFEFIKHNSIDMLTMITKKHSFFDKIFRKSISEELALHTDIPLLTLHE
jgi:nucleotide-binding universal stress UspA family protein